MNLRSVENFDIAMLARCSEDSISLASFAAGPSMVPNMKLIWISSRMPLLLGPFGLFDASNRYTCYRSASKLTPSISLRPKLILTARLRSRGLLAGHDGSNFQHVLEIAIAATTTIMQRRLSFCIDSYHA